jgi:DNA-damage-inducible protein J
MRDTVLRMKTTVIHTRIDADLKIGAENVLKQLGLSSSEAVRMFYRQIELNQGIPFDVKIPNKLTAETLSKSARDEDVYQADDVVDLFDQLGI